MSASQEPSFSQATTPPQGEVTSSSQTLIPACAPFQTQYALGPRTASPPLEQPSLRTILDRVRPTNSALGSQVPGSRRLPVSRLAGNIKNMDVEPRGDEAVGLGEERVGEMVEQNDGEEVEDTNLAQTEEVVRQNAMDEVEDATLTQDCQQGYQEQQDQQSQQGEQDDEGIAEPVPDEYDMEHLIRDYPYEAIMGDPDDSGPFHDAAAPDDPRTPDNPEALSVADEDDSGANDLSMDLDADSESGFENDDLPMDLDGDYGSEFNDDPVLDGGFLGEDDSGEDDYESDDESDDESDEEDMDAAIDKLFPEENDDEVEEEKEGGEVEMDYMDGDDMLEDESQEEDEAEEEGDLVALDADLVLHSALIEEDATENIATE
jgi:hypothetical protein